MSVNDVEIGRPAIRGPFTAEQLSVLWALQIQDHRLSLERDKDGRELAVIRSYWAPDAVAATLAKGTGEICLLTSYRVRGGGTEPELEAAFPSFAMAVFALGAVFTARQHS